MPGELPSLSTDQLAALIELHERGSLRAAAEGLFISEQGVRNRLIALEERLGVQLYRKRRGIRRQSPLTAEGEQLLPHARELLARARELGDLFRGEQGPQEIQLVASQYLIAYVLIDVVKKFHDAFPQIRVRLASRTEREIESALDDSHEFALGVAAPYEAHPDLIYHHLFSVLPTFVCAGLPRVRTGVSLEGYHTILWRDPCPPERYIKCWEPMAIGWRRCSGMKGGCCCMSSRCRTGCVARSVGERM